MAKRVRSSKGGEEGSALNPEAFQRISSMRGRTRRPADALTAREKTIAARVALGLSNAKIAGDLKISIQTVKNHLCSIFEKVGVASRLQLATWLFSHDCSVCPLRNPSSLRQAQTRGMPGPPLPAPVDVSLNPWRLT
jgi:DNA-binding NarL/FixJ family response regulator